VKGVVRSLILGSAAAAVLAAAPAWAELKIGYVNYNMLLQASPAGKAIADSLQSEIMQRQRELQALQQSLKARADKLAKDGATMSEDQRAREDKDIQAGERELQRKQSEAQEEVNSDRNEQLSKLQKSIIEQVGSFAKSQNYDLVVAENSVIYFNPSLDITQQVLAMLEARSKAAAPAASKPPAGK